jgi:hypothetical protein
MVKEDRCFRRRLTQRALVSQRRHVQALAFADLSNLSTTFPIDLLKQLRQFFLQDRIVVSQIAHHGVNVELYPP